MNTQLGKRRRQCGGDDHMANQSTHQQIPDEILLMGTVEENPFFYYEEMTFERYFEMRKDNAPGLSKFDLELEYNTRIARLVWKEYNLPLPPDSEGSI
jgi:hypothetical protein